MLKIDYNFYSIVSIHWCAYCTVLTLSSKHQQQNELENYRIKRRETSHLSQQRNVATRHRNTTNMCIRRAHHGYSKKFIGLKDLN